MTTISPEFPLITTRFSLIIMIEEEIRSGLHPSSSGKLARAPLIQTFKDLESVYASRILFGENNVKIHLLMSAVLAQIDGLERGIDVEETITEAIRKSARNSLELLKQRTQIFDTPSDTGSGEPVRNGDANSSLSGDADFDFMNVEQDIGLDFVMQDGSPSFDINTGDSWLFPGWEENNTW